MGKQNKNHKALAAALDTKPKAQVETPVAQTEAPAPVANTTENAAPTAIEPAVLEDIESAIRDSGDAPVKAEKAERKSLRKGQTDVTEDGSVVDHNGNVLFRRVRGGSAAPVSEKKSDAVTRKSPTKLVKNYRPGNPATLKFPSDRWGLTGNLKKAVLEVAQRIGGDERKKALVDEVMGILTDHYQAKFERDRKMRDERTAELQEAAKARAEAEQAKREPNTAGEQ